MFYITERLEEGYAYVEVLNSERQHLFSCGTIARARAILERGNCMLVAACWQDATKAPSLEIAVEHLAPDAT